MTDGLPPGLSSASATATLAPMPASPATANVARRAVRYRLFSVARRRRSSSGSAARCALRLFNGAPANATVGHSSKQAVRMPP